MLTYPSTRRLSHEYLTQQINELIGKVKGLEKRTKKAPDDVKPKSFLERSQAELKSLSGELEELEKQMKNVAEYFCEDPKKFKIENLFTDILVFVKTFEGAVEVSRRGRSLSPLSHSVTHAELLADTHTHALSHTHTHTLTLTYSH